MVLRHESETRCIVCNVNVFKTHKLTINTYQLIDGTRLGDLVRYVTENRVPDRLHSRTPDLDVMVEGVVSPRDVHHKRWDKNTTPDLMIDIAWKIVVLEFLVLCHFDFFFGHKCLV
jgi:hypothetical protein